MRAPVLPFAFALAAFGLVGMVGVRQGVAGESAPMPVVERGDHTIPIFYRYSPTGAQRPTVEDWTPAHEPGFALAPGDTVKVLTVEQWRALEAFPTELQWWAARTAVCESNFDATQIGAAGEIGAWQVMPNFHGPVPSDLAGQARQVAALVAQHGTRIWSTAEGCDRWSR